MNIAFNTLKFIRHLKQAGLSEKQAEALAEAHTEAFTEILETQLATKEDASELKEFIIAEIAELRLEMAEFKESMTAEFAEFKESMRAEFAEFKESMTAEFAEFKESMRAEMTELRSEMTEFKDTIKAEINRLHRRDDQLDAEIRLLKWMIGFNLAVSMAIMWKLFF